MFMDKLPPFPDGLAWDLASFHNTDPADALAAINAAIRGEFDPMRRYGVQVDPMNVAASIWGQTKDAHGDFARTSDSLGNRLRAG